MTAFITSACFLPLKALAAPTQMPDGILFDAAFYAKRYPDVTEFYESDDPEVMYLHYITFGMAEGRLPYEGAKPQPVKTGETAEAQTVQSAAQTPAQPAAQAAAQTSSQTPAQPASAQTTSKTAETEQKKETPMPRVRRAVGLNAKAYYDKAVFIGDSVMAGYRNYLAGHKDSQVAGCTFLAAASYSAAHALKENDSLHPMYKGKKQPVWKAISQMDVDRVFIMFGTNDLVVKDAQPAADDVLAVVDRIREFNPGKEIHIISMSPVAAGVSKGALNNPTIRKYNTLLQQGAAARGVYYVDLNSQLVNANGDLESKYCSDRYVHQTATSYAEVWDPLFVSYATGE
ncbi:MAG: hypothetical protein K6B72_09495 [Lachnospiraceae bacterium]|nr:hypothetical protein [Lachnospiraceae bacterium]